MEVLKKSVTKWLKSLVVSCHFHRFKFFPHNDGQPTSVQLSCGESIDQAIFRLTQEHCQAIRNLSCLT